VRRAPTTAKVTWLLFVLLSSSPATAGHTKARALRVAEAMRTASADSFMKLVGQRLTVVSHYPDAIPPDDQIVLRGPLQIANWFSDHNQHAWRVTRKVSCARDCCAFEWPEARGENQHYFQEVCFDRHGKVRQLRFGN
jgi:hypothetical protein